MTQLSLNIAIVTWNSLVLYAFFIIIKLRFNLRNGAIDKYIIMVQDDTAKKDENMYCNLWNLINAKRKFPQESS